MRKIISLFVVVTAALVSCETAQKEETAEAVSPFHDGIQWSGEDETANYLSSAALGHWVNIEFDRSYALWELAVKKDPTLFGAHTMLAMMSQGEKKEMHKRLAKEHVADNNETSKLFVSLVDAEDNDASTAIWAKIRELSNGPFIQHMYARSLGNPDDFGPMIAELDKVIQVCAENNITSIEAASYNIKAYILQQSGDMEGATAAAEKYVELWDGSNSLDSRAEMYLFAGDTTNAIAWYKKTVDRYPFARAAREQLQTLDPPKADTE